MPTSTVRISEQSGQLLRELANRSGETMQSVLDAALEEYRRNQFFKEMDEAFAALQDDPEAWSEYQEELREWDGTLMDGIDRSEVWHTDGTVEYVNQK